MTTPRIISTSVWAVDNSGVSRVLFVPTEAAAQGDVVFVWTTGATGLADNAGTVVTPDGWTVLYSDQSTAGFNVFMTGRLSDEVNEYIELTRDPLTADAMVWYAQAVVVRNVTTFYPYWEDFDDTGPITANSIELPAMDVFGVERRVMHYLPIISLTEVGHAVAINPLWTINTLEVRPLFGGSVAGVVVSAEATVDTAASNLAVDTLAASTFIRSVSVTLVPRSTGLPDPARPARLRLGCPDSYRAWITDLTYRNTLGEVGWSSLNWSRVLDEISTAGVTLPDKLGGAKCCAQYGGIRTWKYGLLVERNDQRVWSGPITSLQRQEDALVIGASDNLARAQKRLAIRDAAQVYTSIDSGLLFRNIINLHSRLTSDQWRLVAPDAMTAVFADRTLRPRDGETAWALLEDLMGSSVDAYMAMSTLYVWDPNRGWLYDDEGITTVLDGPYNAANDMEYGLFTSEAFSSRPLWSESGDYNANFVMSVSADSGEEGFRRIFIAEDVDDQAAAGVLDYVDTSSFVRPGSEEIELPDSVLQRRAETVLALRRNSPTVVTGGVFSESAPIDIENLRPGSIYRLDVEDACYTRLLGAHRLKRVDVTVTPDLEEKITPTLQPIGWAGLEG